MSCCKEKAHSKIFLLEGDHDLESVSNIIGCTIEQANVFSVLANSIGEYLIFEGKLSEVNRISDQLITNKQPIKCLFR